MAEPSDEQQIRDLIATWLKASAAGDLDTILGLMSEDVVFLLPGRPPMRGRDAFAAGFRTMENIRIDGASDIQEISISGSQAYCWNKLSITITPLSGGPAHHRAGNVLTIFRKEADHRWRLFRDANLLTEIQPS